jgi:hypothetical protein
LKDLANIHFPRAKTIVLVQDNLNIHSKASLYEAFPAAEARRLVKRFTGHDSPLEKRTGCIALVARRILFSSPATPSRCRTPCLRPALVIRHEPTLKKAKDPGHNPVAGAAGAVCRRGIGRPSPLWPRSVATACERRALR